MFMTEKHPSTAKVYGLFSKLRFLTVKKVGIRPPLKNIVNRKYHDKNVLPCKFLLLNAYAAGIVRKSPKAVAPTV
jgi:hypothetical protein